MLKKLMDELNTIAFSLEVSSRDLWEYKFPSGVDRQERVDIFRAALNMEEARSVLVDVEVRLREYYGL